MCWNCGCLRPEDDHGNPNNITTETLRRAGEAGGQKNIHQVISNMDDCHEKKVHGTAEDTKAI